MPIQRDGDTFFTHEELREKLGFDPHLADHFLRPLVYYKGMARYEEHPAAHDAPTSRGIFFVDGYFWPIQLDEFELAQLLGADGIAEIELAEPAFALVDGEEFRLSGAHFSEAEAEERRPYVAVSFLASAAGPIHYWSKDVEATARHFKIPWPEARVYYEGQTFTSDNIDPRERATLLRIIKTLALAQGLTLDKPHSAANQVEALAAQNKVKNLPASKTIAERLKNARDVD